MFRAPAMLLPHESTVAHEQRFVLESRDRENEARKPPRVLERTSSQIPHVRPETPLSVTHNHDEDFSDDDSDDKTTLKNGEKVE